jgi:hypothetical protein
MQKFSSPWGLKRDRIHTAMELEPASTEFSRVEDPRPRLWPPLPVTLVAIADVTLPATAGSEKALDEFYIRLLGFEREENPAASGRLLIYRSENFRLNIAIHERPVQREDFRPLGVIVPSLAELVRKANEATVLFTRQRGLFAGNESLIFTDPAGNLVEVSESRLLV